MFSRFLSAVGCVLFLATSVVAQDPTVAPLMRLAKSGRLPAERMPQIMEMLCKRGGPEELEFVFQEAVKPKSFSPALRIQVLQWLADAAKTRKVKPAGNLDELGRFIHAEKGQSADLSLIAIELASLWNVKAVHQELPKLATNEKAAEKLRRVALEGLAQLGDDDSLATLTKVATSDKSISLRYSAVAALSRHRLAEAADLAVKSLLASTASDDPTPIFNAFLLEKGGSEKITAAIAAAKLKPDVAKRCLRAVFAIGSSDAALQDVLSQQAGIEARPKPPTNEEALQIAAKVMAQGNAARGEAIFRRSDLSCFNCHSLVRAGGQIGPELTAVGKISPPDYIVMSILNPNIAIKEEFVTHIIETSDGKIITGIVKDRDAQRIVLRTADGRTVVLPADDVESEEEGRSLMPEGITKFLTEQEFLDLARFVSELGKEGPYALPTVPALQRWRVLNEVSSELRGDIPNVEQVREYLLDLPAEDWRAAYAKVSGELPLAELNLPSDQPAYLYGEVDVSMEGDLSIHIDTKEKAHVWIDAQPFESAKQVTTSLTAGRHKILLRIDPAAKELSSVRVTFTKPEESSIQFDVVGGQ